MMGAHAIGRSSAAAVRLLLVATLGAIVAGCGSTPFLPPAAPLDHLDPGATPPPGGRVRFDRASLEGEGKSLVLEFVGGRPYDTTDPCSSAYVGWASPDPTDPAVLHALVIDVTPRQVIPNGMGCDAVGHQRFVQVELGEPFEGERVVDDTDQHLGTTWFLRAPRGLAVLPPLPQGWVPGREESLPESPGGRWSRAFVAPGTDPATPSGPGVLQVIQGFGEAAGVTGGEDQRDVTVNGSPAVLYRAGAFGELVLVWRLGQDGMGLVANEADVTVAELIRFAEGIRAP